MATKRVRLTNTRIVYFIKVGRRAIKIGFTTNLENRLKSFRGASAEQIEVLAVFPGDRHLEKRLHGLLAS